MTRTGGAAVFVSGVLTLAACAGGAGSPPEAGPTGPPICDARFAPPAGFEPTDTFKEEYNDRIGVRLGYADADNRELHAFAGIPGEFGEGLPDAGTGEARGGRNRPAFWRAQRGVGHLVGRGRCLRPAGRPGTGVRSAGVPGDP